MTEALASFQGTITTVRLTDLDTNPYRLMQTLDRMVHAVSDMSPSFHSLENVSSNGAKFF
jgi:hypothetical protein